MHIVFAFVALGLLGQSLVQAGSSDHASWNYADPNKDWCPISNGTCCPVSDKGRQSPIDLQTKNATINHDFLQKPLKFSATYFDEKNKGTIINNGHTAQFSLDPSVKPIPTVSGGPLGDKAYEFAQLHFHWGPNNSVGSEHTLNGKRYPMEVHLVHFKQAYGSLAEAAKYPDGLAVLGVFYEVDPKSTHSALPSSLTLSSFFLNGVALDKYVSYQGSLTTPNCNEIVTWINFLTPKTVTVVEALKATKDEGGNKVKENFRPVQHLNGRKLSASTAAAL